MVAAEAEYEISGVFFSSVIPPTQYIFIYTDLYDSDYEFAAIKNSRDRQINFLSDVRTTAGRQKRAALI